MVVGASGVIFGWLGLLLMRGIVERSWWNIAVALLVGLLYGWQLLGVLPTDERVSWQGHLFGLLGGMRRARSCSGVAAPTPAPAAATTRRRRPGDPAPDVGRHVAPTASTSDGCLPGRHRARATVGMQRDVDP